MLGEGSCVAEAQRRRGVLMVGVIATRDGTMSTMTNASGFDSLGFGSAYEIEADPEFPANGTWSCPLFAYDRDGRVRPEFVSRWGAPRIVRVQPANGAEWVGMFPAGGLGGISGVFATPSPERLCVLVDGLAYLVRADAPGDGAVIAHDQVEQVFPAVDPPLLLLVRGIDIVALGADGVAWRSPRLAVDDLRVLSVDPDSIRCTGDLLSEERASLIIDPTTGQVASGPRLEGPPWNSPDVRPRRRWWRRRADRKGSASSS